jgi:polyhydroxyalkanoate synthesis regulator protein
MTALFKKILKLHPCCCASLKKFWLKSAFVAASLKKVFQIQKKLQHARKKFAQIQKKFKSQPKKVGANSAFQKKPLKFISGFCKMQKKHSQKTFEPQAQKASKKPKIGQKSPRALGLFSSIKKENISNTLS